MTDKFADIRKRLEAVSNVNWDDTDELVHVECVGDWHEVGPVRVPTTHDPLPQALPWASEMSDVAWFIQNAARDIRLLLGIVDRISEMHSESGIRPGMCKCSGAPCAILHALKGK